MQYTWDIDPVLIHLYGQFGIRYYGLMFSFVFVFGFLLFRWQIKRAGGTEDDAYGIIIPGALGTIIGARLGHILFYQPHILWQQPLWVIKIWEGGLASHGALIGLLVAIWLYAIMHRQSYLECLDRFSMSVAVGTILIRVGNFFNSEIVGRMTNQEWGVRFPRYDGLPPEIAPFRHPSQLYEAGLGCVVLIALLLLDRILGEEKRPRGAIAGAFLTIYFTGRFIVEFFKEYQALPNSFPLTMGQMLSIPAVLLGAVMLWLSLRKNVQAHWNVVEEEPAEAEAGSESPKA